MQGGCAALAGGRRRNWRGYQRKSAYPQAAGRGCGQRRDTGKARGTPIMSMPIFGSFPVPAGGSIGV
ncbi:hypothetical protein RR11_3300 [Ruegeria sp. R11]|nr:hypothetical protein RR11_3300 [Ruegeria sp. R11]